MMHVCHLTDGSVGGDYFRNIARGFAGKGVKLSLIQLVPGEAPDWLVEQPDVSFLSLGASSKLHYPLAIKRLAGYLNSTKADLVHTHLYYGGLVGVLAGKFARRTKVALMRHHTSVVRMLGSGLHVRADKWMAETANHVMAVSEAARRYMLETDGILRSDIEIVYLGLDIAQFAPDEVARSRVRTEFGFNADDLVIGYVGNMLPAKGHAELVGAFDLIKYDIPNAKLLLIGRGMLPEVESAIKNSDPSRIIVAGWRADTAACYNAMDLFVQPSLSEAFSQVLLEAMSTGLPVVATNVGGAAEVIEDGANGYLAEPGDARAIADKIVELNSDARMGEPFGRAARETIELRFNAEKMVERHLDLYRMWVETSHH